MRGSKKYKRVTKIYRGFSTSQLENYACLFQQRPHIPPTSAKIRAVFLMYIMQLRSVLNARDKMINKLIAHH